MAVIHWTSTDVSSSGPTRFVFELASSFNYEQDLPPTTANKEGVSLVGSAFKNGLAYFYTTDGSTIKLDRWILNSVPVWVIDTNLLSHGGTSPSIVRNGATRYSVCYIQTGSAKHSNFDTARGELNVQTIGTGTLVDHIVDSFGRLVCAVYNTGWKIQVGTLNSDGVNYTFSSQVSMGITASERRGSLCKLPNNKLGFAYIDGSSVAKMVICSSLSNDGTGTWA